MADRHFVMGQVFIANGTTTTDRTGRYTTDQTITVTGGAGNFTIYMTQGMTGTVTSGGAVITGSPVTLNAGSNTLEADGNGDCTMDITIGSGANWNSVQSWSAASGGTGGASVPTTTDDAYFDANSFSSGSQTVTVNQNSNSRNLDWAGATNTPTFAFGIYRINIYGDITFIAAMATSGGSDVNDGLAIYGSGAISITSNGLTLTCRVYTQSTFSGTLTLLDALNLGTSTLLHLGGTIDTNGQTVTCGTFENSGATAKTLTLGASIINCTAWNYSGSNLTLTANTSTIKVTGTGVFTGGGLTTYNNVELNGTAHTVAGNNTFASLTVAGTATVTLGSTTQTTGAWICAGTIVANTSTIKVTGTGVFTGGGETYNNVELNGSTHTVSGSNTFAKLALPSGTTQTITFTDGTTQTITSPVLSGDSSHRHTLTGTSTGGWALTSGVGSVWVDYCTIIYSTVGTGSWRAPTGRGNVDGDNNVGWNFLDMLFGGANSIIKYVPPHLKSFFRDKNNRHNGKDPYGWSTEGLVFYLPLWALQNNTAFKSIDAYGHLCTVTGALWQPNGRTFDGTDDKVTVSADASLLLGSGDFTLEFWVYKTGLTDAEYLMGTSSATKDIYLTGTGGAIKIDLEGASTVTSNTGLIEADKYIHLVIVRSGDDCIIYKNGVEFQTIVNGFASGDNTTDEDLILGFNS